MGVTAKTGYFTPAVLPAGAMPQVFVIFTLF